MHILGPPNHPQKKGKRKERKTKKRAKEIYHLRLSCQQWKRGHLAYLGFLLVSYLSVALTKN